MISIHCVFVRPVLRALPDVMEVEVEEKRRSVFIVLPTVYHDHESVQEARMVDQGLHAAFLPFLISEDLTGICADVGA
jgi:hypothetical protein